MSQHSAVVGSSSPTNLNREFHRFTTADGWKR